MSKLQILHETIATTLGALASQDVLGRDSARIDGGTTQGFRVTKIEVQISFADKTAADGPVDIGISQKGLSASEIEECLEADPQGDTDIPATEQSMRVIN